jgi:hypothetical protein
VGLHVLDVALVLAETVDNKRLGTGSDLLNDIFEATVCEYWHYRSENLLPHQLAILTWLLDYGW